MSRSILDQRVDQHPMPDGKGQIDHLQRPEAVAHRDFSSVPHPRTMLDEVGVVISTIDYGARPGVGEPPCWSLIGVVREGCQACGARYAHTR